MERTTKPVPAGNPVLLCLILLNAVLMKESLVARSGWDDLLPFTLLLLIAAVLFSRFK